MSKLIAIIKIVAQLLPAIIEAIKAMAGIVDADERHYEAIEAKAEAKNAATGGGSTEIIITTRGAPATVSVTKPE